MRARARKSASAPSMISSKAGERWLISSTDMPTPGRLTRSRRASSSTGRGSTAGPAEKLKMRVSLVVVVDIADLLCAEPTLQRDQLQVEHGGVAGADLRQQRRRRLVVEV